MNIWIFAIGMMTCCFCASPSAAQQVHFELNAFLNARDSELPYTLNLGLNAAGPTRVGVNALLDLREIQKTVPEQLANNALVDSCGLQVKLDDLSIVADNNAIALESVLGITRFDCGRISQKDFRRGNKLGTFSAKMSTVVSVELRDNCAYLKVPDLNLSAPDSNRDSLLHESTLSEVKNFLLAAIDLVLSETPLCPELPAELSSLDPSYEKGGPREIGDGGLGVLLNGSIDVSPSTIIDVLLVLQRAEKIPASP